MAADSNTKHQKKTPEIRPLLRWAGSKKKLIPILKKHIPNEFDTYIEPFCGSVCFFLEVNPAKAILGDLNHDLILFYNQIKHSWSNIYESVHNMPNTSDIYYQVRETKPKELTSLDAAIRFFYLNRYCFNGVYRTNKNGDFNVPRGKHMGRMPTLTEVESFSKRIQIAKFINDDFSNVLATASKNDFIYLDPPYAGRGVKDRGEYGPKSFRAADIERLSTSISAASERGAKILLSYADIPIIREIFKDWHIEVVSVSRNVSGFVRGRSVVNELIIKNY